jgi:2-phosphoglycerate kinase
MSKIINLFGGPGIGKSSIAAGLTYKLKKKHISCDAPYEFPKVLAWDKNKEAIGDQLYVVANQHRGIAKSYGKVKYIIVDSPILLSLDDNLNIILKRNTEGEHNDDERYQGLSESIQLDNLIQSSLDAHNIPYIEVMVDDDTVNNIIKLIG